MNNRPQLQECAMSTPAARIPKWRSTLRHSFPITINGNRITSEQDVVSEVQQVSQNKQDTVELTFATIEKSAMHPQTGVPILYHDQLNIIAKHIAEINEDIETRGKQHRKYIDAVIPRVATIKPTKRKQN